MWTFDNILHENAVPAQRNGKIIVAKQKGALIEVCPTTKLFAENGWTEILWMRSRIRAALTSFSATCVISKHINFQRGVLNDSWHGMQDVETRSTWKILLFVTSLGMSEKFLNDCLLTKLNRLLQTLTTLYRRFGNCKRKQGWKIVAQRCMKKPNRIVQC